MNKENVPAANIQRPIGRVTRAGAKALGASGGLPPLHPAVKQDHKRALQPKTKRTLSDDKSVAVVAHVVQPKRRAVLKDITNNHFDESSIKVSNGNKLQISKRAKRCAVKKNERVTQSIQADSQIQKPNTKAAESITKQSTHELSEANLQLKSENGESEISSEGEASNDASIIDIDSKHNGPQMCSLYAAEIYAHLCTTELKWRHSTDYMKTVQLEITKEMRGIVIDWLVEICQEYGIASETFYLTVALIDIYLSKKCIGKRRLQLLGITCMLVASRFLLAAQTSYKVFRIQRLGIICDIQNYEIEQWNKIIHYLQLHAPVIELEFLANYLAELTQIEYSFIKFLPSLIATSAVYLAKWTLDQDEDPWDDYLAKIFLKMMGMSCEASSGQ